MDKQDLIKYQDHMCMAMNIIRDRHINDKRNFKGKPQFLKFCRSCGRHGHSVSKCPTYSRKKTYRPQSSLNTHSFHKHMTSNQDLPNKKLIQTYKKLMNTMCIYIIIYDSYFFNYL